MKLNFCKRIDTPKNSIFYSLIKTKKNEIVGFCKQKYNVPKINFLNFGDDFKLKEGSSKSIGGEDPRCFYHKDDIYVVNNLYNNIGITNTTTNKYTKITLSGKNFSFISHKDELYFIHFMRPFSLYKLNTENGYYNKIDTIHNDTNYEYRGGTPGYPKSPGIYYGFGHRTYVLKENNTTIHDVFYWEVDFNKNSPEIKITDIEKPKEGQNIFDPTCVIEHKGKKYLVSAETKLAWFVDQDYITNLYEIEGLN